MVKNKGIRCSIIHSLFSYSIYFINNITHNLLFTKYLFFSFCMLFYKQMFVNCLSDVICKLSLNRISVGSWNFVLYYSLSQMSLTVESLVEYWWAVSKNQIKTENKFFLLVLYVSQLRLNCIFSMSTLNMLTLKGSCFGRFVTLNRIKLKEWYNFRICLTRIFK